MKKWFAGFLLLCSLGSDAQLNLIGNFNPAGVTSLCALGYDHVQGRVWIYNCFGDSLLCYDTTGQKLFSVPAPGEAANDVDIEIAPTSFVMAGTSIPQGSLLFVNGETDSAEIYAIDPLSGIVLDTLLTSFGNSHVVGGAYHIPSGSFYLIQDNVPSATLSNRVAEVHALSGQVIQSYQIASLYDVSYGDLEGAENGHLYVVSSIEDSILEITAQGQLVQMHDLPAGVSNVSGFDFDCGAATVWLCNTNGVVYHLGQSNCNSATGVSTVYGTHQVLSVSPNPSGDVFQVKGVGEGAVVYDLFGAEILRVKEEATLIDLRASPAGAYVLRTTRGEVVRLIKY
ncbi:MAG: T9SS type A sorting domain-containing protein [Bacteroidia bacterium]|nr:T9SS type A sorting domain-containing protein [Bacteroidia bacterium]